MTKANHKDFKEDSNNKTTFLPFISLFLEGKLDEDLVKDQLETLLIAGYEPTTSTIANTILILAMHPSIQDQVFDELRSIYESPNGETTYEHIQKMHLLNRVINEVLRLCPPAHYLERSSTVDIPISNCVIPKGTMFLTMFYTLHRVWQQENIQFIRISYKKSFQSL